MIDTYKLSKANIIYISKVIINKLNNSYYLLMVSHTNLKTPALDLRSLLNKLIILIMDNKYDYNEIYTKVYSILEYRNKSDLNELLKENLEDIVSLIRSIGSEKIDENEEKQFLL